MLALLQIANVYKFFPTVNQPPLIVMTAENAVAYPSAVARTVSFQTLASQMRQLASADANASGLLSLPAAAAGAAAAAAPTPSIRAQLPAPPLRRVVTSAGRSLCDSLKFTPPAYIETESMTTVVTEVVGALRNYIPGIFAIPPSPPPPTHTHTHTHTHIHTHSPS